ncbi:MAG: hypothetical protein ACRDNF_16615, partial [Streptosporangiaceae bacterium]
MTASTPSTIANGQAGPADAGDDMTLRAGSAGNGPRIPVSGISPARPPLIRALNEQLLLEHIRKLGPCSRAELARASGL